MDLNKAIAGLAKPSPGKKKKVVNLAKGAALKAPMPMPKGK